MPTALYYPVLACGRRDGAGYLIPQHFIEGWFTDAVMVAHLRNFRLRLLLAGIAVIRSYERYLGALYKTIRPHGKWGSR